MSEERREDDLNVNKTANWQFLRDPETGRTGERTSDEVNRQWSPHPTSDDAVVGLRPDHQAGRQDLDQRPPWTSAAGGSAGGSAIWPPGHEVFAPMAPEAMDADRERFKKLDPHTMSDDGSAK
jgi:hypothetical protein